MKHWHILLDMIFFLEFMATHSSSIFFSCFSYDELIIKISCSSVQPSNYNLIFIEQFTILGQFWLVLTSYCYIPYFAFATLGDKFPTKEKIVYFTINSLPTEY